MGHIILSLPVWHVFMRARTVLHGPGTGLGPGVQGLGGQESELGGRASGGRVWTLWAAFARVYEDNGDFGSSRVVFAKALGVEIFEGGGEDDPTLAYSLEEPAKARLAYADDAAQQFFAAMLPAMLDMMPKAK